MTAARNGRGSILPDVNPAKAGIPWRLLAALRERQQTLRLQPVERRHQVFAAVFAGRDDDVELAALVGDEKAPALAFDAGDRGGLGDRPPRAVRIDPADKAEALVMVEEGAFADAADLVTPWHAHSRRKVTTSTSRCPGRAGSSGETGVTP